MFVPSSYTAALLLLLLSWPLLALWPALFERSRERWRYQFFSVDFALGAFAVAALSAFTFGWLGPDATFSDHLLIAGGSAAITALAAGMTFGMAAMFLFAGISLLDLGRAVLVAGSLGLAVGALFTLTAANATAVSLGVMLLLLGVRLGLQGAGRAPSSAPQSTSRERLKADSRRRRGIAIVLASGLLLAVTGALLARVGDPEFGPGAYAVLLLMSAGVLLATACASVFLTNISIEGPPVPISQYFRARPASHALGLAAGATWALGALCALLGRGVAGEASPGPAGSVLPALSVLTCAVLARATRLGAKKFTAGRPLIGSAFCYLAGVIALAIAWGIRTSN